MALVVADRVLETSSTAGTGTLSLLGAVSGYKSFSNGIGNGNSTYYCIYDLITYAWEVGIGTYTASGSTLSRTTVLSNSLNTTALINFAGNTMNVFCTLPSEYAVTFDNTATLTNKRINPRVSSTTSTSTLTPDISANDQYVLTAQAVALTVAAPTGTPVDGNRLIIRILDNGSSQTISWNATYTVIGTTLPTSTTANKTVYVGCIYNANNTRWDVIAITTQA